MSILDNQNGNPVRSNQRKVVFGNRSFFVKNADVATNSIKCGFCHSHFSSRKQLNNLSSSSFIHSVSGGRLTPLTSQPTIRLLSDVPTKSSLNKIKGQPMKSNREHSPNAYDGNLGKILRIENHNKGIFCEVFQKHVGEGANPDDGKEKMLVRRLSEITGIKEGTIYKHRHPCEAATPGEPHIAIYMKALPGFAKEYALRLGYRLAAVEPQETTPTEMFDILAAANDALAKNYMGRPDHRNKSKLIKRLDQVSTTAAEMSAYLGMIQ